MRYVRFSPERDVELLDSFVECYRQVFASDPWNEWQRCSSCGHHWGIAHHVTPGVDDPRCCDAPEVTEFWPVEQVAKDLDDQLRRPGAACWVAVSDVIVVGFCFGYILPESEFDEHLEMVGFACHPIIVAARPVRVAPR